MPQRRCAGTSRREDHRRMPKGDQVGRVAARAMAKKAIPDFTGDWQRHISACYKEDGGVGRNPHHSRHHENWKQE